MALSRRAISVTTVVVVVSALSAGIWWRLKSEGESADEDTSGAAAQTATAEDEASPLPPGTVPFSADEPDPVEGAEAILDTLWIYVNAPSRARAARSTEVAPLVSAEVREVAVREGQRVAEGAVLARLDTAELALGVRAARARVLQARADFERLRVLNELAEDGEGSLRAEVDRAESGLTEAEAALRTAELGVERATLRAPFAGRVTDLEASPGQQAAIGQVLMSLRSVDPMDLEVDVLESAVPDLVEGRAAEITFAAFPGEVLTGRIHSINPMITPERRAARVRVRVSNADGRILPGMYAEVALQARGYPDRVMVPRTALLERGIGERRDMLFVFEEGRAMWRYVNPGLENERYTELLPPEEGPEDYWVEPGEIVLVDGHHYMAHDTRVRLVESVFAAGGRPGR